MKFLFAPLAAVAFGLFAASTAANAAGPMSPIPGGPEVSTALEKVQYRGRGAHCKTRVGTCPLNLSGSKPLGSPCGCKFPHLKARASGYTVR